MNRFQFMVGVIAITAAGPLYSHHAFVAECDSTQPVTLTGHVSKVEWMNPHARLYVDVHDNNGKVTSWELELSSPNALLREGWNKSSLKPGDGVTVTGFRAKNCAHLAIVDSVTVKNGRRLFESRQSGLRFQRQTLQKH